jgi:hypothetical protein
MGHARREVRDGTSIRHPVDRRCVMTLQLDDGTVVTVAMGEEIGQP